MAYPCAFWRHRGSVKVQIIHIGCITLPVVDPNAIFTLEQPHILKRINMVANSGFAAFALIGNVLIRRPAFALVVGVVGQLDKNELTQ